MSKETFSRALAEDMLNRIFMMENLEFLESNDTFKLALAIAYMTLSKESIIKKDLSNKNRRDTSRLHRRVSTVDIDSLFTRGNGIQILTSDVWDCTWILDTIRDSILHEHFDIDEETRTIFIDNTMYGKRLEAIVSYDWFFRYVDQDILSKRITDHFTTKGFFYNNYSDPSMHPSMHPNKKNNKNNRNYAVANHILYKVDIQGDRIRIEKMEKIVHDLFLEYAKDEITQDDIQKYQNQIPSDCALYPFLYNIAFLKARDKVIADIKRQFPDCTINITVDHNKRKLMEQSQKKLPYHIDNYDDLFKNLNELLGRRTNTQLHAIANLYDYIDGRHPVDKHFYTDFRDCITRIVHGNSYEESASVFTRNDEVFQSRDMLIETLIQVYGLAILAINKNSFNHQDTSHFVSHYAKCFSSKAYKQYAIRRRKLMSDKLDYSFKISEVKDTLEVCPADKRPMFEQQLQHYVELLEKTNHELDELEVTTLLYPKDKKKTDTAKKVTTKLRDIIEKYLNHFENVSYRNVSGKTHTKIIIKGIIMDLLDRLTEVEDKYYYCPCDEKEALNIIRNSFSHVGRVKVNLHNHHLYLYDFDNDGNYSGMVQTDLKSFVYFLNDCLGGKSLLSPNINENTNVDTSEAGHARQ